MKNNFIKSIYKCPVCQENLMMEERRFVCLNNHSYDIAERGYVNLMLANQKKTKDPGDNKGMIESRRDFLNKGYYKRFSDLLNEIITGELHGSESRILDAGCGEGYYISNLRRSFLERDNDCDAAFYGTDISKNAIIYAAKRDRDINLSVGSSFDLPIMNNVLDCVIRNFAPGDDKEFYRVLKWEGILVIATPGVEHLYGLKEKLYEKPRKNDIREIVPEGFRHIEKKEVRYEISLNDTEDIVNLISMTPYYWSITDTMRSGMGEISELKTELDFKIDVFKKINGKG